MRSKILLGFVLLPLLLAQAAAAGNGGFAPVRPESDGVDNSTDAYYLIAAFALAILLIVFVPLLFFIVRFRNGGRPRDEDGAQIRGNDNLELAWTVGPVLILVVIGSFIFYKLPGITMDARAGEQELVVKVEGRQFYWRYVYPNGVVAIDKLHAPVDRLVRLELTAPAWDVIHSYWVPAVSGKFDTIPGVETDLTFRIRRPGIYRGQCAELCGIQHAAMLAEIEAVPADEFEEWLTDREEAQSGGDEELGKAQWEGVCSKCHAGNAVGKIGPPIAGSPQLADEEAIATLVQEGRGRMPAVGRGWTDDELESLTGYLKDVVSKEKASGSED